MSACLAPIAGSVASVVAKEKDRTAMSSRSVLLKNCFHRKENSIAEFTAIAKPLLFLS